MAHETSATSYCVPSDAAEQTAPSESPEHVALPPASPPFEAVKRNAGAAGHAAAQILQLQGADAPNVPPEIVEIVVFRRPAAVVRSRLPEPLYTGTCQRRGRSLSGSAARGSPASGTCGTARSET
jgi:hypothetical protein